MLKYNNPWGFYFEMTGLGGGERRVRRQNQNVVYTHKEVIK